MKKYYLFQDERSKLTHAVTTKWTSIGTFELDRIFGGGFKVLCGRKAAGKGIFSENIEDPGHATCKKCLAVLKLKTGRKPEGIWPPRHLRKIDQPRILGIPG